MKILHTAEFYWPSIGGSQEVVRQISERLVKLGHDVAVATTKLPERSQLEHNGVKIVEFAISGNAVHGFTGDTAAYQKFLVDSDFDVLMNYAAQQWATDLAFPVLDKIRAAKVLIPCGYSGLHLPEYAEYFAKMPSVLKDYDASIYLSANYRDINFAREHGITNLRLIPNGAGADEFEAATSVDIRKQLGIAPDTFLILTVGSHTGMKGHDETIKIFRQAKLPRAVLVINGNDYEGKRFCSLYERILTKVDHRILPVDLNRSELVAAYKASNLFLFTSNVEASPLVLFEAMAGEVPFLTTDVGNAAEIIQWSGGGKLLPTTKDGEGWSHANIKASAVLLGNLSRNQEQLNELARSGHAAWRQRFSWEVITEEYEKLYKELIKK